jgi:Ca-activated chloride channel homolog
MAFSKETVMRIVSYLLTAAALLGLLMAVSPGHAQLYGQANRNDASLQASQNGPEHVLFILDASDSMNERMGGGTKFQAAKDVILKTIQAMPPGVPVGLRVYGHRMGRGGFTFQGPFGGFSSGGDICRQTQLLTPIGVNNRASIASQILGLVAVGKTPITYTLQEAVQNDFQGVPGKKTIILVSDGRETCSHNPCDLALAMVRNRVDIKINTIGFGTHDRVADDQLKCIALSTKGTFYSANTAAELAKSLEDSAKVQTSVQAKIYPGP